MALNSIREFYTKNYTTIKQVNPNLPILIWEASSIKVCMFAHYEKRVEKKAMLNNLPPKNVKKILKELMKS
ncbi:hypothetical protein BC938DRAFT_472342 [Jimgerdemannia flammicorona]|uniref:Ribosomal protein/NADH dehydrogenase domain-containing protein n=1 Tax=Jimgerdemannia flammicorona TaxID=994334 RepID=A0A433Q6B1_9FUNG|nr:hypothetical protein BC938DRAFT_472342 [Jimgerdemannia flammicorona]